MVLPSYVVGSTLTYIFGAYFQAHRVLTVFRLPAKHSKRRTTGVRPDVPPLPPRPFTSAPTSQCRMAFYQSEADRKGIIGLNGDGWTEE